MEEYLNKLLKDKKVLILGFGKEGESTLSIIRKYFPVLQLTVADSEEKEIRDIYVTKIFGKNYLDNLNGFNLIIKSPGISLLKPELQEAIKKGVKITSQTKIFFDICIGKIIGITGTKGKSTTSSLLHKMLLAGGRDAFLVGNIGSPVLNSLENDNSQRIYVFELSSHQLFDLDKSPEISIVTNVALDHLDWYQKFETYVEAKANIIKYQNENGSAIINYDNLISRGFDRYAKGKVYFTSKTEKTDGAYFKDGEIHLKINGWDELLGNAAELKLLGKHNIDNVMFAAVAAKLTGVTIDRIWNAAKEFENLEHHLEFVKEVDGKKFYNDSFAVDQIATIAAIDSFNEEINLILGGFDRGIDYSELSEFITKKGNIKNILIIGEISGKIASTLKKSGFKNKIYDLGKTEMDKIVDKAYKISATGSVILFSPAAASFDMFKDYKDRGLKFKDSVLKLNE
jgi:UDP-N-acetylmuramoylalanine--D-glutamate ligase